LIKAWMAHGSSEGYGEPFSMRSSPYWGGAGRQTHLRGSWAAAVTGAVRAMVAGLL
jgi:hypothetical protein